MLRRTALLGLLSLAAAPLAACGAAAAPPAAEPAVAELAAADPPAAEPLEPALDERSDADVRLVEALRRALEAQPSTLDVWLRELPDAVRSDDGERDLGFGARRLLLDVPGGRTRATVMLLGVDGAIARVRLAQFPLEDAGWPSIAPALVRAWTRGAPATFVARVADTKVTVERSDAELVAALDARLARELGDARPESPPGELEEAYRTLLDPFETLWVGTACGFTALPPHGREQTQALVGAARFDLLRCVLRGPNPEARAYAAHALLERGAEDAADAAAIETLARLPLRLIVCAGCTVFASDWQGARKALGDG